MGVVTPVRPRGGFRKCFESVLAVLAVAAVVVVGMPAARAVADGCTASPVVCENQLAGAPASEWDLGGASDSSVQGFGTAISVNVGESLDFKVKAAHAYSLKIYRLGWYGGNGARLMDTVSASLPATSQPACTRATATDLVDCGGWSVSASWSVPATAVSGVYIALLTRTDDVNARSHIPFVVRKDGGHSDVVYQTADTTWQAYNLYGGTSLYHGISLDRARKVSYNRPWQTRDGVTARDFLFANEYPMLRLLEQNGVDVSYISGLDSDTRGGELLNHKVFLSVGHDEYWSSVQRANVTAARDAGVNLAFFGGNDVYWRTRWEPDAAGNANRVLVCYKDTKGSAPTDPVSHTGTFRDPRYDINNSGPENSLIGTQYQVNNDDLAVTVNAAEGKLRLWRNTDLGNQAAGTQTVLAPHTVGYESNEDVDNGFRPAGLIRLSTTTGPTPEYLVDYGSTVVPGTTTHHLTEYRAPSGALVFSAGSINWSQALDPVHDGNPMPADPRMRQATLNILADMGALPATIAAGLSAPTQTTDTTAPVAAITAPTAGQALTFGQQITVTGTATDTGGLVAGVEVSLDAGTTWHPATGRETWTYTGVLQQTGADAIQARAIDDSAQLQPAPTKLAITAPCPCNLFGDITPKTADANDAAAVTLGMKFQVKNNGFITGIRFYKSAQNTGTHTGRLYTAGGTTLAQGTFTAETTTGWQTLNFDQAVEVTTGVTYVAAYYAPSGHYAGDGYFFDRGGYSNAFFTAPGGQTQTNGVYAGGNAFPSSSYHQTNYYVDALFSPTDATPLKVTATTPVDTAKTVLPGSSVTATFNRADVTPESVSVTVKRPDNSPVAGATSYDAATRVATFTPADPFAPATTYTATASSGTATKTWQFTTAAADLVDGNCPCRLFNDDDQPTTGPVSESASVQLGLAFTPLSDGTISGIRFFTQPGNTAPHTVTLRSASGSTLGTATSTSEGATGWQQVDFAAAVPVAANTTYVASYLASNGHYPYAVNGLAAAKANSMLSTPANAGRYSYGTGALTNTSPTNYFVDVVFTPAVGSDPTVNAIDPADDSTSVSVGATVSATFDSAIRSGTVVIKLTKPNGDQVAGSLTNPAARKYVFTPAAPLTAATRYTVSVTGAVSVGGATMSPFTSHFTTSGACPCTLFASGSAPATADSGDGSDLTLGLRFKAGVDGWVTGIRYYRAAANTGTHVGKLWLNGTLLATVTFTDSGTGWQTASFSRAVAVNAGTTYTASYYAPNGHYSATQDAFVNELVNAPLTGVLGVYSSGNAYPTSTFRSANYWVDVVFADHDPDPPLVTAVTPANAATGASTAVAPSATFERPIDQSSVVMTLKAGTASVSGTVSTTSTKATFTPGAPLVPATTYTVSVSASSTEGKPMAAPKTWSFTTAAGSSGTPISLYPDTWTPGTASANDNGPVTLGLAFTTAQNATVTAVRFYNGAGNTGTRVASIWSANGTELGSGSTTSTTLGWITVELDEAVAITPGVTYTIGYRAPTGHYAYTSGGLAAGLTKDFLTVPANGARYTYGSGMPTSASGASYGVDLVVYP